MMISDTGGVERIVEQRWSAPPTTPGNHHDIAVRGDVRIDSDGLVVASGRWSDPEPSTRDGFVVHLDRATEAATDVSAVPSGRSASAQSTVSSGPERSSLSSAAVPTIGLGAAMFAGAARSPAIDGGQLLRLAGIEAPLGGASTPITASMRARRESWRPHFTAAAERHGIDPELLLAVGQVESGFDVDAVSSAGAQGLMQFMPATAREMGVDPFDPESAIDGAARYLRRELDRFGRSDLAIAAYNAGAGAVRRHGGVPPYAETQRYVEKVVSAWRAGS